MVNEDIETVAVVMKIRVCDACSQRAVSLEGPGADCPSCTGQTSLNDGVLRYTSGDVQTVELTSAQVEQIPDSEIMEIKD